METKGKKHSQYRHGYGSTRDRNPLYNKWSGMKRRCLNPKDKAYKRYGGAGVNVSKEWMDFENFRNDMEKSFVIGLSLERIDNTKGYSKENCKWIPLSEQSKNRKNVPKYTFMGKTLTSNEWDREIGLKEGSVRNRIRNLGWSVEKALTTKRFESLKKSYKLLVGNE